MTKCATEPLVYRDSIRNAEEGTEDDSLEGISCAESSLTRIMGLNMKNKRPKRLRRCQIEDCIDKDVVCCMQRTGSR